MKNNKVCVLIPWNGLHEAWLTECLSSLRGPECIVYQDVEMKGPAYARNQLIESALKTSAEYFAWQDADDTSHFARWKAQAYTLDNRPDIVQVGSWIRQTDDKIIKLPSEPEKIQEAWMQKGMSAPVSLATSMMRRCVLEKLRFREEYRVGGDRVFNIEIAREWPLGQLNLETPLYIYRRHSGSTTRRARALKFDFNKFNVEAFDTYGW